MYRMIIITAIGNYTVEMEPPNDNPTNDDLMEMFYNMKSDIEGGCFLEGWTPTDSPTDPPGVFALGDGVDILAYHVEKKTQTFIPVKEQVKDAVLPVTYHFSYLGNVFTAKCVQREIQDITVFYCYSLNGEPPTDVLSVEKISGNLCKVLEQDSSYTPEEYLLQINDSGKPENFSQASEVLKKLAEQYKELCTKKTGKAWNGWKGDGD